MWRRRRKRCSQLSRQLALGLLEDALGQVDEAQRQAEEQAAGSGKDQPAEAAASVPAPRASRPPARPGWLFPRAQDKTAQPETSDRGEAGQAPEDSRPRRL